jgi:hypothetical protein
MNRDILNTGISIELNEKIKNYFKTPTEKYSNALTSSQEVGWFDSKNLNTRARQNKKDCDVTKYADYYYSMIGRSPFARKEAIVKDNK